jgi:hypothetical protein
MHFTASFGHKNPYPNGEAEKTGNPRSKVAGFFLCASVIRQTGKKNPQPELRVNPSFGRVEETGTI